MKPDNSKGSNIPDLPDSPQPPEPPTIPDPGPEPPKADTTGPGLPTVTHWEIKMAFSERKDTKWTPKQVSLDYVSVASDEKGGDPPTWPEQSSLTFGVSYPSGILTIYVNRDLGSKYGAEWVNTYGTFWLDDCRAALKAQASKQSFLLSYISPAGTEIDNMSLQAMPGTTGLALDTFPKGIGSGQLPVPYHVLGKTPSRYAIIYPPDYQPLGETRWLGDVFRFFYQDQRRAYVASPVMAAALAQGLTHPNKIGPAYGPAALAPGGAATSPDISDPPIFEPGGSPIAQVIKAPNAVVARPGTVALPLKP